MNLNRYEMIPPQRSATKLTLRTFFYKIGQFKRPFKINECFKQNHPWLIFGNSRHLVLNYFVRISKLNLGWEMTNYTTSQEIGMNGKKWNLSLFVEPSKVIFVRNLSFDVTVEELKTHFPGCDAARIPTNPHNDKPKGYVERVATLNKSCDWTK